MVLNGDDVMKLTAQPYLYVRSPFLEPMRQSALAAHAKLGSRCKPCMRAAFAKATQAISSAFCRLVYEESKKTPNRLPELKKSMAVILGKEIDEVVIPYKVGSQDRELKF
jgi:hypothetical protein